MVYLIHFDQKYKHCQHYLGFSKDKNFTARIDYHLSNQGSRLIRAVNIANISWSVVRTWPKQDGNFERTLKKRKKASSLCPVCMKIYENLSEDQKAWLKSMIAGTTITIDRKVDGKTIKEFAILVKFNLAYPVKHRNKLIGFNIPEGYINRVSSLLKDHL